VVYMLDPGDEDPDDQLAARFCFADPRIDACCPDEPGRVTRHVMPTMTPGTMLIFASDYMHSVNPYHRARPRTTIPWNSTTQLRPERGARVGIGRGAAAAAVWRTARRNARSPLIPTERA